MPTAHEIIEEVIRREGGYVNHPNDKGGPTKYGVTLRTLSAYYGRQATLDDVKNLDREQAEEIFLRRYFVGPRLDTLPSSLHAILVDTSVLFGPRRAVEFAQSICNQAGFGPIDEDGVVGPTTRATIKKAVRAMKEFFVNAIVEERIAYHRARVEAVPSQEVFLKGWINRAEEFRVEV